MIHTAAIDTVLGTPSTQKILRLLYCWEQLTVKELVKKTRLSESQVYNTLRSLESINLVEQVGRGIYTYGKDSFSLKLKEAYIIQLIQIIGNELHELSTIIDTEDVQKVDEKFTNLVELWEPILDGFYPLKASSLASLIVERLH